MKLYTTILAIVLLLPMGGFAQFDESKGRDKPKVETQDVEKSDLTAITNALKDNDEGQLVTAVSRVLSKDSKNLKALNALGVFYFKKGDVGLAKIIFERALQDYPEEPGLHNNMGIVYLADNDQRKAIAAFRKGLSYKSNYLVGAVNLSSIFLDYRDYSRALAPLEEGYDDIKGDLRRGRENAVEVANNYAVALTGVGKGKRAADVYEKILDSDSRNVTVLMNYAILLIRVLDKSDDGLKLLSKLKFISEDPKVQKMVAQLEREVEKKDK